MTKSCYNDCKAGTVAVDISVYDVQKARKQKAESAKAGNNTSAFCLLQTNPLDSVRRKVLWTMVSATRIWVL